MAVGPRARRDEYLEYVQQQAREQGRLFVLDAGEGRSWFDPDTGWYVEDLSGWLIEECDKERFLADLASGKAYERFGHAYVLARWYRRHDGGIGVDFA